MCKLFSSVRLLPHQIACGMISIGMGIAHGAKKTLWAGREVVWLIGDFFSICLKLFLKIFYRHYDKISLLDPSKTVIGSSKLVTSTMLKEAKESLTPVNETQGDRFNGQEDSKD